MSLTYFLFYFVYVSQVFHFKHKITSVGDPVKVGNALRPIQRIDASELTKIQRPRATRSKVVLIVRRWRWSA